jgi:hypothetical protein
MSSKWGIWDIVQESNYKALDRDITQAMLHAKSMCLVKNGNVLMDAHGPWLSIVSILMSL